MSDTPDQTERDSAGSSQPALGWSFGTAGWPAEYVPSGRAHAAHGTSPGEHMIGGSGGLLPAEDDPEATALRLWNEGRRDQAIEFLEARLGRGRASAEQHADIRPAGGGELEGCRVATPALLNSAPAEETGKLIHLAPEPRIDPLRAGVYEAPPRLRVRPAMLMAVSLLALAGGASAAFWPEADKAASEAREISTMPFPSGVEALPAPSVAADVAESEVRDRADAASASLQAGEKAPEAAPPVRPAAQEQSGPALAEAPAQVTESLEKDLAGAAPPSQPGSSSGDLAEAVLPEPPLKPASPAEARVTPQPAFPPADQLQADSAAPRAAELAEAEPGAPAAAAPEPARAATRTARLPSPRPAFDGFDQPREVVVADAPPREVYPPPGPDEAYAGEYPPGPDYLPPLLAERRAAAQRYAAARRAPAERRVRPPVVFGGSPVYTIEGPVIPRRVEPMFTIEGPVILGTARGY